ncbi:MAG TPA: DNA polymerase II large subunit, partial [Thermoplasmata archaeon]|nr:DNA polymerase II large subunit [Thermoplasmata archaeon]
MEMGPACSEEMRGYFSRLQAAAESCYRVARAARAQGFDPELEVEIPLTEDLASRVERLLKDYDVAGVASRIRELSQSHDREEVSILVAKELARRPARTKAEAVERAVRVGLAILTEGILVAPLEGVASVKIKGNKDGSSYVDLSFAGPIRSAGGTGQALSVLIADVVRRELGIGRYVPEREEIERFKEEVQVYRRVQHLQYTPTDEEVELIVANCPVAVDGEGTEDEEISGYRDLPRIETNRVRGGACLVVADGLCLKAPKIQKHVRRLKIDGWEFIDRYLARKAHVDVKEETDLSVDPSDQFIQQLVAGRPVLCHPSRPGGFRLRYGRARSTGLAALAIHPATMYLLNQFIAIGTQIKTERPGKAAAITPCEGLEPPLVLLKSGDFVAVEDVATAKRVQEDVESIIDLGEILVPYGEFLENNHVLMPGAYALEWYREELRGAAGELPASWREPSAAEAIEMSERYRVPLHPRYNLFWHDIAVDRLRALREAIAGGGTFDGRVLRIPADPDVKATLVEVGATHSQTGDTLTLERYALPLLRCLGLTPSGDGISVKPEPAAGDPLAYVSALAGFPVRARGPTRIGARMGRPEKAAPRKMQPAPHGLFPLGKEGGPQRLVKEALRSGAITIEVGLRTCATCGKRWFLPKCTCGGHTVPRNGPKIQTIPLDEVWQSALARVGIAKAPDV